MAQAELRAPERAPMVWTRATVVGAAGLGSAVASHQLGGGLLPPAPVLAGLLAVSVLVSAQLLLAWASTTRLVLVVVGAQTLGHLVLSATAGHAGDPATGTRAVPNVPSGTGPRSGNLHDVYVASLPQAEPAAGGGGQGLLAHQWQHLVEQGPAMVLAHTLGAVALGVFLARGEQALRAVLRLARDGVDAVVGRVPSRPAPLVGLRPERVAAPCATPSVLLRLCPLTAHLRRGPPVHSRA